jgi:SAM-dependent methyltransferase
MEANTIIDKRWSEFYRLPPPGNMMESHEHRERVFTTQGTAMAQAIVDCIQKYRPGDYFGNLKILDFGCGPGRVALPLFYTFKRPGNAVDVDPGVISYLKGVEPGINAAVSSFQPPLPFESESFDVVYAISVWTHLTAESAHQWLNEIRRILRPNGLALLTTSNYPVLAQRRKHPKLGPMGWDKVSDDELRQNGFIFISTPPTPGTGAYGMASHDPDWIRREWASYMRVEGIESGAILGVQDINVLVKSET